MLDNDMQMFNLLFKVVEKVDSEARVSINKTLNTYKIIVTPTTKNLRKALLVELTELSNILGDMFEFPKTQYTLDNIYLSTK